MQHKKWKKIAVAAVLISAAEGALWFMREYNLSQKPAVSTDFIMDTIIEQKFYGKNAELAVQDINEALRQFEAKASMYRKSSEIASLNEAAGTEVALSPEIYDLLKKSKELSQQSQGAFDITVGPLTKLWGVTSSDPHVPEEEDLAKAMSLVGIEDLHLNDENRTAKLLHKGQAVDLGGIAKGAVCDIVRDVAEQYGITTGYASIGGDMVVLDGKPRNRDFTFGIRDPKGTDSQAIGAVMLYGQTMATTGGYERFFEEDGVTYCHVINPKTGWPAESDLLSVSVISEDGALADFLSTTLFILGKDSVIRCLDRTDFQVIALAEDDIVYCSKSLEGKILPVPDAHPYQFVYGG